VGVGASRGEVLSISFRTSNFFELRSTLEMLLHKVSISHNQLDPPFLASIQYNTIHHETVSTCFFIGVFICQGIKQTVS
jgi:hypothetical protein